MTRRGRGIALAVVACVMVLDIVDLTIVNVALPTLRAGFAADDAALQWMVAGYASMFAVLLVSGGRLGDIYGYRRMMVLGLAGFCAASVACGLAPNVAWLVAARLAQGVAAALMLPQIMALVQLLYAPQERVRALGLFGVLGGAAAVAGPVVGGLIIGADLFGLGWRPIFLVNLPLGLILIAAATWLLPNGRSAHAPKLDLPGTLLATGTLAAVMVPLVEGRQLGWPLWAVALPLASPLLAGALWRYSRVRMAYDRSALLIPDLFDLASYRRGATLLVLFQAAMAGLLFTLTLALQQGLGLSATEVGVAHIPFALGSAVGIGAISSRALPRFGAAVLTAGALMMAAGVSLLVVEVGWLAPGLPALMPAMALAGLGMGLVVGPLTPVALSQVEVVHAGGASGLLKSLQEFGGALGVAVLGGAFLSIGHPLPAFVCAGLLIATLLLLVAALTLRLPRDLPVFAAMTSPPRSGVVATGQPA